MLRGQLISRMALLYSLATLSAACAGTTAVNPNGPAQRGPAYPAILRENEARRSNSHSALAKLLSQPESSEADRWLRPITATIRELPQQGAVYLPQVGAGPAMTEEQTREAVRRFLIAAGSLVGADPTHLSLAQENVAPDGSHLDLFEQRPFNYPLRGDYGRVRIDFRTDRRVTRFTSTAIPSTDTIQTALSASKTTIAAADVSQRLIGSAASYMDAGGVQRSFLVSSSMGISVLELVVCPVHPAGYSDRLEFHLAWEVQLANAPTTVLYLDAVNGSTITPATLP